MTNPVRYHSIIEVPLSQPAGSALPLLCLDGADGEPYISRIAFLYARALQRRGFSADKIHKFVRALGLLSDFARVTSRQALPATQVEAQTLLEDFAEARLNGTVDFTGIDSLGLYWPQVSLDTANYDCTLLAEFGEWLAQNADYTPEATWEARFIKDIMKAYATSKKLGHSMFLHLKGSITGQDEGSASIWEFQRADRGRRGIGQQAELPKAFPPAKVIPFIQNAENIRDKLLFLLMAFGGPRASEALHLYVQDVMGVDENGCAIVRLAHPEDAIIEWVANGAPKRGTRTTFLRERYRAAPRTRLGKTDPLRLGWKGMSLDRTGNTLVQWIGIEAGQLFWKLHVQYIQTIRAHASDTHPYYFINTAPKHFGTPMKLNNLDNQFYQTARRTGLSARQEGVNPHGLRHFYGYMLANVLRVDPEVAQEAFHHASLDSTMVYYRLAPTTVRASLDEAMRTSADQLSARSGGQFAEIMGNLHAKRLPSR